MIGVINLENHDSLTWKLFLYYHNNHFYLVFLFVIFSINSTVTMQIEVLLLKLSLPDMFCSSSSYFIWISWKCSDLVYSPATINKHPLVSVTNFHGVWGEKKKWRSISVQFSSGTQSCPTLCDPMNCSMRGLLVHHQLPEFTQTHIHRVSDAIQPSHPIAICAGNFRDVWSGVLAYG